LAAAERLIHAVLHVHRCQVDVSRYVKYHRDLARSVVAVVELMYFMPARH